MELGWEPRSSLARQPRDSRRQPGEESSSTPPASFLQSSILSQRRRSSATQVPPPVPPPKQPIPRVPYPSVTSPASDTTVDFPSISGTNSSSNSHGQLSAAIIRSRLDSASNSQPTSLPTQFHADDHPSLLAQRNSSPQSFSQPQGIYPDRLLLSPDETHTRSESRPSSRRALTRALELAREAVKLDSTNNDPFGAVIAYGRSVALLSEVMERVRRGEDDTESSQKRRNGRRRSVVAQEEEVRRLKSIHDTYADRMNILSLIYSIPPIPQSSCYNLTMTSSIETQIPSPTSASPSSDISTSLGPIDPLSEDVQHLPENNNIRGSNNVSECVSSIGLGMFWDTQDQVENIHSAERSGSISRCPPTHPYAAVDIPAQPTMPLPTNLILPLNRTSSLPAAKRPRATLALPPPPPPPRSSPPPAPPSVILGATLHSTSSHISDIVRTRESTAGHHRTGSRSKLAVLEEEVEKQGNHTELDRQQPCHSHDSGLELDTNTLRPDTPRTAKRDSPLPALPSPTFPTSFPNNSLNLSAEKPPSPLSSNIVSPRPRGSSAVPVRLEAFSQPYLINTSTTMGTISQRRSKASAPSRTRSSSPAESTTSVGSIALSQRLTASSLPATTVTSLGIGRSRASSQPGRRPSLINGRISPLDQRPPLPTATLNGSIMPRKTSFPSKLNPNNQGSQTVTSIILPLSGVEPPTTRVLVLPMRHGNLPTTPTSPLPSAPPNDILLKPYHLMNLLRTTMTSKTGGYITRRLHVPQEVWSQGGAKLSNVLEKVRTVEVLCSALEDLQNSSVECFGAGFGSSGLAIGTADLQRKEGEAWLGKLEEFSSVCDGVVANFGKKLGVGEGFVLKKSSGVTSWGGKLTRQLDKFTNGKNLDSPAAYVLGLSRLFSHAQLLDEHTRALSGQPGTSYAGFPLDVRTAAEAKLRRSSEFFANVVLTFVVRDLSQLLDKYAKKCEKWLAE